MQRENVSFNKCDVVKCRLPHDVFVARRKKGWRSAQAMVQMVHVSESLLRPRVAERLPILLLIGRCSDLSFALDKNRREHFGSERRCGALPLFKDGRWGRCLRERTMRVLGVSAGHASL